MDDLSDLVDRSALGRLRRLGGDRLVVRMIDLFLLHAPQRLESARAGARVGDRRAVEQAAHSLKSSAANLGAHTMQMAAEGLEQHASDGAPSEIALRLLELERAFETVAESLRRERERLQA